MPTKRTPAKKAAAKRTPAKKAAAKRTPAVRASTASKNSRLIFDTATPSAGALVPIKESSGTQQSQSSTASSAVTAAPQSKSAKTGGSAGFAILIAAIILGPSAGYLLISEKSNVVEKSEATPAPSASESVEPQPSASPKEEVVPTAVASSSPKAVSGSVLASYTYTSTGIRLSWKVESAQISSISVSSSEDGKSFTVLQTLDSNASALSITKTDTEGETKFRVTITPTQGKEFSSTIVLRGRYTI